MAALGSQSIKDSYPQLLHTDTAGGGNSTTLVSIKDGDNGTTFALQIATDKIQVNGNATITTADNTDTLTLISTDIDAHSGPNLRLYRNSGSDAADSDIFGQINFDGRNNASEDFVATTIKVAAGDVGNGSEDAQIEFDVMTAGTLREYMRMASGSTPAVIFNQDSQDIDFRVLSDNLDPAFFVQGSDGLVGIGTASPSDYHANGNDFVIKTSANTGMTIVSGSSSVGNINFADGTTGNDLFAGFIQHQHGSTDKLVLGTKGANRFILDDNSRISLSNNIGATSNTVFGYQAANIFSSNNANNVVIGHQSMDAADGGETANISIGYGSMGAVDEGASHNADANIAIGYNALTGGTLTDGNLSHNIAIGYEALDATGANDQLGTIAIGYAALGALTSGASNIAIGYQSLDNCNTGSQNVAVGESALGATDDGASNVAIGNSAMGIGNAGHSNVAVGSQSMVDLTGNYNTAVGMQSAFDLTSGVGNVALGALALKLASGGESFNVAIGVDAMTEVIENGNTADSNIAIGAIAMKGGTLGGDFIGNIAIGRYAMDDTDTNAHTGTIAIGHQSLTALTSGASNVAIGYQSQLGVTDSIRNTSVGYQSLKTASTGDSNNTAIGYSSLLSSSTGGSTAVGSSTLSYIDTGENNTAVGYGAMTSSGSGNDASLNVAVGYLAHNGATDGDENVVIGASAGLVLSTGVNNVLLGSNAGLAMVGSSANVVIGKDAGKTGVTMEGNVIIGTNAGEEAGNIDASVLIGRETGQYLEHTDTTQNVAIGKQALRGANASSTAPRESVAIGYQSMMDVTTGTENTAVGSGSHANLTTGTNNVVVGCNALNTATTQDECIAIGKGALYALNHDDADGTVAIGFEAGVKITEAIGNTAIGYRALYENTTGDYNIAIGHNAMNSQQAGGTQSTSATSHNNIFIGVGSGAGNWADAQSSYNVAIGNASMDANMNGALSNTAIGYAAMSALTTGDNNVAIGKDSAVSLTTGGHGVDGNVIIGATADCASGSTNRVAIGYGCTSVADNSVTLGNANVTAVYMAQDSGAKVHMGDFHLQNPTSYTYNNNASNELCSFEARFDGHPTGTTGAHIAFRASTDSFTSGTETARIANIGTSGATNSNYSSSLEFHVISGHTMTKTLVVGSENNTDRVQLPKGRLQFPASQNADSDANTLDDYEEGYFTGALTCGSGTVTVNGSYDQLAYTKIGRMVHVQGALVMSSISSPSGTLVVNLPFTSGTLTEAADFVTGVASYTGVNALKSASLLGVRIGQGANTASLVEFTTTTEDGSDAADNITASTQIYFGFSYMV